MQSRLKKDDMEMVERCILAMFFSGEEFIYPPLADSRKFGFYPRVYKAEFLGETRLLTHESKKPGHI